MRIFLTAALLCAASAATPQYNISFAARLNYQTLRSSNLANLWGYTDELGNEYAIVGVNGSGSSNPGGVSIVALNNPTNPREIFFRPGPASTWREVKVWNHHAYITTEAGNGGLTIVDLNPLPQSTALNSAVWRDPNWDTSHALYIDENGRLYIYGANSGNGGVIMYDLTQDPMNPVEVGRFDNWYAHDGYARGDTMYTGHITRGFLSIVDVRNPASPRLLGTQATPNNFTHNVWLDDSGKHLFTTDERPNSYVGSYDVSDPTDIKLLDKLQSDPGGNVVPHNTYWLEGGYLATSYYTYGVVIYDVSRPHNMVEVGHYDTTPLTGSGFNGAWGVYPYFPSKRLIVSDIERGLYVLDPTYVRACWLEGTVRSSSSGITVGQATVTIMGHDQSSMTGPDGLYATGYRQSGTYSVLASAPGYASKTISGVTLQNGIVTQLDIDLDPLTAFSLLGTVVDAVSGDPIPGARVEFKSPTYTYNRTANASGVFQVPAMFQDDYTITAGQWGWRTSCPNAQSINATTPSLTIPLDRGYYDDFTFDYNWAVSSTATAGRWVRGAPIGTTFNGTPVNPGSDVDGDCGGQAYITGNGGGSAGNDDIDDGWTRLTSPVFDATVNVWDPVVRFHRWFYAGGGTGTPNDTLRISLSNGSRTVVLETVLHNSQGNSSWQPRSYRIRDHLTPTNNMRLIVYAVDANPGHLVEAGLDLFEIVEGSPTGIPENTDDLTMALWPNPSDGRFQVRLPDAADGVLELFDAVGRSAMEPLRVANGLAQVEADLPNGTYVLRATLADGTRMTQRLVVRR